MMIDAFRSQPYSSAVSALVFGLPLVSALTLQTPSGWQSSTTVNISWTSAAGDPPIFTLELQNTDLFHQALALANNLQTSAGFASFQLGVIQSGYVHIFPMLSVCMESGVADADNLYMQRWL